MGLLDAPGLAPSFKSRARWRDIAALGDSMTAPNSSRVGLVDPGAATALTSETYSHGFVPWFQALSGRDIRLVYNGGHSGQRSGYILTQADAALSTPVDALIELCGINDIIQYATAYGGDIAACENGIVSNRQAIWDKAKARGTTTVALSLAPVGALGDFTTAQRLCLLRVNDRLKRAARERTDVIWVDIHAIGVDVANANAYPKANYALDTLHPTALYAFKVGQKLNEVIGIKFAPLDGLIAAQLDSTHNDALSLNLFRAHNGLFVGGTTGTMGTGVTGAVHEGWAVDRGSSPGTPTGVCSIVAAADGVGNAQRVEITAGGAGEFLRILANTTISLANYPVGTRFDVELKARISNQTNLRTLHASGRLFFSGGASTSPIQSNALVASAAHGAVPLPDSNFDLTLAMPPVYVPLDATALTTFRVELLPTFNAAGSATIDISRVSVRVTKP